MTVGQVCPGAHPGGSTSGVVAESIDRPPNGADIVRCRTVHRMGSSADPGGADADECLANDSSKQFGWRTHALLGTRS